MNTKGRQFQRGISFVGLLFLGVLVAALAIVGARVVPAVTEYMAIQTAVKHAAAEGSTAVSARVAFDRVAAVESISSIAGKDLEVTKEGEKVIVSFAYNKEISLAGPVYLLIKFSGSASGYN